MFPFHWFLRIPPNPYVPSSLATYHNPLAIMFPPHWLPFNVCGYCKHSVSCHCLFVLLSPYLSHLLSVSTYLPAAFTHHVAAHFSCLLICLTYYQFQLTCQQPSLIMLPHISLSSYLSHLLSVSTYLPAAFTHHVAAHFSVFLFVSPTISFNLPASSLHSSCCRTFLCLLICLTYYQFQLTCQQPSLIMLPHISPVSLFVSPTISFNLPASSLHSSCCRTFLCLLICLTYYQFQLTCQQPSLIMLPHISLSPYLSHLLSVSTYLPAAFTHDVAAHFSVFLFVSPTISFNLPASSLHS